MSVKAEKDFEIMQNNLTVVSKQELDALRSKYEAMLEEIRANGNADKESTSSELQKNLRFVKSDRRDYSKFLKRKGKHQWASH